MGIETVAAIAAIAGGAATAYSAMNQPDAPKLQPPTAKPQASQVPDAAGTRSALAGSGQGGGAPGIAQTFLSGTGGVDPSLLQLGRSTLLGGGGGASLSRPAPTGLG